MPFFFTRKALFQKNKRLILFYCDSYIDSILKSAPVMTSCKDELMKAISSDIDKYENEIAAYTEKNTDFSLLAKRTVSDISFDLIDHGKYHLHGRFNPSGPGKWAAYIHKTAVKEFLDSGFISQEEYDEDLLALQDAINQYL